MAAPPTPSGETVILYGMSHLGVRVAGLLARGGFRVVAVVPPSSPLRAPLAQPGVEIVEADLTDDRSLSALPVVSARALVLPSEDEHLNLRAALVAADLNPTLRIVLRLFDLRLGARVERDVPGARVLSVSQLAAPAFAAAAILERPLHALPVGDGVSVLHEAAGAVFAGTTVSELEATGELSVVSAGADLFPPAGRAIAEGEALVVFSSLGVARRTSGARHREVAALPPRARSWSIAARLRSDAVLRATLAAVVAVVAASTAYFVVAERLTPIDALYFVVTTLTTTGYGDITMRDGRAVSKLVDVLLMLSGISLTAMLFAMVTDGLLKKRQDLLLGRSRTRARGHVILCGAGDVGIRVLAELVRVGEDVVVIEKDPAHRHHDKLREMRVRSIVSDASHEETLLNAGVSAARAIVCATDDDMRNLEIALTARTLAPGLRVVLRIFDRPFAGRIERRFGIDAALSSSDLAAPAFVAAALAAGTEHTLRIAGTAVRVRGAPPADAGPGHAARGEAKRVSRREDGGEIWLERVDDAAADDASGDAA